MLVLTKCMNGELVALSKCREHREILEKFFDEKLMKAKLLNDLRFCYEKSVSEKVKSQSNLNPESIKRAITLISLTFDCKLAFKLLNQSLIKQSKKSSPEAHRLI